MFQFILVPLFQFFFPYSIFLKVAAAPPPFPLLFFLSSLDWHWTVMTLLAASSFRICLAFLSESLLVYVVSAAVLSTPAANCRGLLGPGHVFHFLLKWLIELHVPSVLVLSCVPFLSVYMRVTFISQHQPPTTLVHGQDPPPTLASHPKQPFWYYQRVILSLMVIRCMLSLIKFFP